MMGIYSHKDAKPYKKQDQNLRKGWRTPYGFIDFKEPVSYEEAVETIKPLYEKFQQDTKKDQPNDR